MVKRNEAEPELQPAAENDVEPSDEVRTGLGSSSGTITRHQLKRLCKLAFPADRDSKWACILSGIAPSENFERLVESIGF